MMKIGIDGRAIYKYIDGIGRYSLCLIRHLAKIDQKNQYVIIRNPGFDEPLVNAPNFREVYFDFPPLSLRSGVGLNRFLQKERVDIFHSLFPISPIFGRHRLIITLHDLMAINFAQFFSDHNFVRQKAAYYFHKFMIGRSVWRSDKIIAVSHNTKQDILDLFGINPDKVYVIHEAIEPHFKKIEDSVKLEQFRKKHRLADKFVLYLGNMKPYKNLLFLISGFKRFLERWGLDFRLVIAGKRLRFYKRNDKYDQMLKQKIQQLNLNKSVQFIDYLPEEELPLLYNCATLFVMPSLYEGFGLPALEAISCGTPSIVSKCASLPEVVGDAAIYFDPCNLEELIDVLHVVLTNEKLRISLSEKGSIQSKNFSWTKTAQQTASVYESFRLAS